jgi:hypothetical protein
MAPTDSPTTAKCNTSDDCKNGSFCDDGVCKP